MPSLKYSLQKPLRGWFWQWVSRRAPKASAVTLRHRSIYVLPTLQGWGFLLVIVLLWLLGTNYQNNLVLGTAFFLLSLVIVSVVHAFRNLSGITFSVVKSHPGFAGEYVEFDLLLAAAPKSRHESLLLSWDRGLSVEADLLDTSETLVTLPHKTRRRGWLQPGRLKVESFYPLGFIRAWSWVWLEASTVIYPAPQPVAKPPLEHTSADMGEKHSPDNQEEFQGFRAYQAGSPLAHVAWKLYAREQGMHLKDYSGYCSEQLWLDWEALPGMDPESRLSGLCYWVLEYGKTTAEYGLRLPGETVPLGRGPAHQARALRHLALYGLPSTPDEVTRG